MTQTFSAQAYHHAKNDYVSAEDWKRFDPLFADFPTIDRAGFARSVIAIVAAAQSRIITRCNEKVAEIKLARDVDLANFNAKYRDWLAPLKWRVAREKMARLAEDKDGQPTAISEAIREFEI